MNGTWTSDCDSRHGGPGIYAKYYEFSAAENTTVVIELEAAVKTYLNLIDATGGNLAIHGGGPNANSKITYTITESGNYTIEAGTNVAEHTGDFTITLTCHEVNCIHPIECGESLSGSWSEGCYSQTQANRYAKYYEFSGVENTTVDIDFESSVDSWLLLYDSNGTLVRSESGSSMQIKYFLTQSGTYTLETLSRQERQEGSFTLTLACNEVDCTSPIAHGETLNGSWTEECYSRNSEGSYSKYYEFTGVGGDAVVIGLESSEANSIYLQDSDGKRIAERSPGETEPLVGILPESGTYTIEAASSPGLTGDFLVTLDYYDEECTSPITSGETLSGNWTEGCYSLSFFNGSGRYAKYYEFSVVGGTTVDIQIESSVYNSLFLLDANGNLIDRTESYGDPERTSYSSQLIHYLPESGTYTIEVVSQAFQQTGSFTVSLDSFVETCTSSIMCGETLSGIWTSACVPQDRDDNAVKYYEFSGERGEPVIIILKSSEYATLRLFDSDGNCLGYDYNGVMGKDCQIIHTLPESGTYTIDVSTSYSDVAMEPEGRYYGEFTLSLSCAYPEIELSRSQIYIGTVDTTSSSESFSITNSGGGELNWTVESHQTWLACTPPLGTGPRELVVSVSAKYLSAGTYTGTITVTAPDAVNSPQTVSVTLTVYESGQTSPPFGEYLTPGDGTVVSSSVPFTGWV
ncbi:MAG: BACON domain-containing protein, partial [bacterium]|nr:BACON domain-containing protein [bacterium]